jgi:hypothetical protein
MGERCEAPDECGHAVAIERRHSQKDLKSIFAARLENGKAVKNIEVWSNIVMEWEIWVQIYRVAAIAELGEASILQQTVRC